MSDKKRRTELDILMDNMQTVHSKRMNALLVTMDDEDFAVNYHKMAEFVIPKLQRREVEVKDTETKVIIEHIVTNKNESESEEE